MYIYTCVYIHVCTYLLIYTYMYTCVCVKSYFGTYQPRAWSNPVLVTFRREKKNVWTLGACSGLILARTCMSHTTTPQENELHHLVLIGFSTRHEFQNKLTTSECHGTSLCVCVI